MITITGEPTTVNNNLIVHFETDILNITDIKLTRDGTNYISATIFDNSSATFDISDWANGTYADCSLCVEYNENEYKKRKDAIYVADYNTPSDGDYTSLLQTIVNTATTEHKKIVFGKGTFIISGTISCPDNCIIEIEGNSDAFANSMQRYSSSLNGTSLWYENVNNETLILYSGDDTLFKHPGGTGKGTIFKFRNISFRNAANDTSNYILKARVVGQQTVNASSKGKVYAENCLFSGFKVGFGDKYVTNELETSLNTLDGREVAVKPTTLEKCCFVGFKCRFVACGCAINLGVDSRIIDCSFNSGWYGIVFQSDSGISTISNCRLEWLKLNAIYADSCHDITIIGNEFDRIGWAGVHFNNCTKSNICSNVFRRCGADSNYDYTALTKNIQIYIDGCTGGVINSNVTIAKAITDNGGIQRPSNSICIRNNTSITVIGNDFTGCATGTNNKIENNTTSTIEYNTMPTNIV